MYGGISSTQGGNMVGMQGNLQMGMHSHLPMPGNLQVQGNMGQYNNAQMQQMQYQQVNKYYESLIVFSKIDFCFLGNEQPCLGKTCHSDIFIFNKAEDQPEFTTKF